MMWGPCTRFAYRPYGWLYPVLLVLAIWMAVDAYRRYGGLNYWHFLLFFFMPIATPVYIILHWHALIRSRGMSGPSLRSRLRKAQEEVRLAGTAAANAELAELYFEGSRYEACEKQALKALDMDPESLDLRYIIGVCRMERGDIGGAKEILTKVIEENPKFRFGLAGLKYALCEWQTGKRDEALERLRVLHRSFPRPLFEFHYARALSEVGRAEKSREVLEDMLATAKSAPPEDRKWIRQGRKLLRSLPR